MPENFEDHRPLYETRARILKAVRAWFEAENFLEVTTPVMQLMPGADTHIHAFQVEEAEGMYLQNSPEFAMKKLLVAGLPKIYQICPVFRREERTRLHNPEFTMLEWYRAGADYTDIMADCERLIRALDVFQFQFEGRICDPHQEWQRITVAQAFQDYAGMDLFGDLKAQAQEQGISVRDEYSPDDVFHAVMAEKIEPFLGSPVPTILYDYPAHMAALSRKKADNPEIAERFELYICGVELANAFSELTDAAEQRARFETDMAEKEQLYGARFPIDEDFLAALEHGLPESGGIALGLDRLVMLAIGLDRI